MAFRWVEVIELCKKCMKKVPIKKHTIFRPSIIFRTYYNYHLFKSFSSWKWPNPNEKLSAYHLIPNPYRPQYPLDSISSLISPVITYPALLERKPTTKKRLWSENPVAKLVNPWRGKNNLFLNRVKSYVKNHFKRKEIITPLTSSRNARTVSWVRLKQRG